MDISGIALVDVSDISGTNFAELVIGGTTDDVINGAGGADTPIGGVGADTLRGQSGADVFQFSEVAHSPSGQGDTILDFAPVFDRIDLSEIDAQPGGTDDPFDFLGISAFSNVAGQLRLRDTGSGNWALEADIDGDGRADLIVNILGLGAAPELTDALLL